MAAIILRSAFVAVCSLTGFLAFATQGAAVPLSIAGLSVGAACALAALAAERALANVPAARIVGALAGLFVGLGAACLALLALQDLSVPDAYEAAIRRSLGFFLYLSLGYIGAAVGAKKGGEVRLHGRYVPPPAAAGGRSMLLDTSVIIDGRLADICETGFVEGILTVPRFVLNELQGIADTADSVKRARGRRGLEVLNRMKSDPGITIEFSDLDFPDVKGVDAKLVALAKQRGGILLTTDYNLNKVAELQGVGVLNVNDLANALKPAVLPGEVMTVKAIKEGKEPGQGVAYLDDGTMVIIEGGHRHLKQNVEVVVTSVLQTAAGRMIFSSVKNGRGEGGRKAEESS